MKSKKNTRTAISRVREDAIQVNTTPVYATYTFGAFNNFYASQEEAIEHCCSPENGYEYNAEWFQDRYLVLYPGELFRFTDDEAPVYLAGDRSVYLDSIAESWQMEFVEWRTP